MQHPLCIADLALYRAVGHAKGRGKLGRDRASCELGVGACLFCGRPLVGDLPGRCQSARLTRVKSGLHAPDLDELGRHRRQSRGGDIGGGGGRFEHGSIMPLPSDICSMRARPVDTFLEIACLETLSTSVTVRRLNRT